MARAVAESFNLPDPILEVGAYQVAGQEAIADLRPFFRDKRYVGLDERPGPGVDVVGDVTDLPYPDGSFGTVLTLSTFEHVLHFWRGFDEVRRILRPDGALLVACPFHFHIHNQPSDYWRFTPAALELLLDDYPSKIVGWHGPDTRPANVWALAFREDRPAITAAEYVRYQERMHQYARMPLPWPRRLRLNVGRLLFGGRHFAPLLLRERWRTRLLNNMPEPDRTYSSHRSYRSYSAAGTLGREDDECA
jgi:SAM-dependent methyltransferase